MKTLCKTCKHINLIEEDFNGNSFCDLYDAFVYAHNEECEEWEARSSSPEFYYYLYAIPKDGEWRFTQQFWGEDLDFPEFNTVISFGEGEYGVYVKTYSSSPGMAFLQACSIITQHIKNRNSWRRDFGQI